jgi:hypothetical protein
MITRSVLILFLLFVLLNISNAQTNGNKPVTVKEFTDNPWLFDPTPQSVDDHYGFLKMKKFAVTNRLKPTRKDTIIQFSKGKTSFFFYQPFNSQPHLMSANIEDNRILLKGNITVGLSADELYSRLSYPIATSDTLTISIPDGAYKTKIIFKDREVSLIKVEVRNVNK